MRTNDFEPWFQLEKIENCDPDLELATAIRLTDLSPRTGAGHLVLVLIGHNFRDLYILLKKGLF